MLRISDARVDGFVAEDVPYVDLTCAVLGIGEELGEMEYYTREDCVWRCCLHVPCPDVPVQRYQP